MPEPKVVRTIDQMTLEQRIAAAERHFDINWISVADAARRFNLDYAIAAAIRKRVDPHKKKKRIVDIPKAQQEVVVADEPKPRSFQFANASFIWCTALVLGGVGMFFNIQYWYNFGGIAFGVLGGAIDGVTVFLPANLNYRRLSHAPLLVLWLLCAGLSTIAALGFAANNIGDSLQGRASVAEHRKALQWEFTSLQIERATITENRDPLVIEEAIQNEHSRAVRYELRAAKRMAEHRIELDGRLHQLSEDIAKLPAIVAKDPGAEGISRLSAGWVEAGMVEQFRVIGFAFMPSLAGFLLAFARTLMR